MAPTRHSALVFGAAACLAILAGLTVSPLAPESPPVAHADEPKPPVLPLVVGQVDPPDGTIDLTWTWSAPVTRWTIVRDEEPLLELPARERAYQDGEPDFGWRKYQVTGWDGDRRVCVGAGATRLLPVPVAAVFCTQLDPELATVVVEWRNTMIYDEIRVYRRKELLETLPGTQQATVSTGVPIGKLELAVVGVIDGVESPRVGCRGSLRSTPDLRFDLKAVAKVGKFDPATGEGTITVSVTAAENPSNPGFPHEVQGLQLATDYDRSLLTPVSIEPGAGLSSPDFFDGQLLPDGITVGVVMDFHGAVTLDLSSEKEVAVATYETVVEGLVGSKSGIRTTVGFRNGLGTGPPIENLVVVDGQSVRPTLTEAEVLILPEGGVEFRRGDLKADGVLTLDDVGFLVATLLAFEAMAPLDDCLDASDLDDDGTIGLVDLTTLVGTMFETGATPALPFRTCGADPTADEIPCLGVDSCP